MENQAVDIANVKAIISENDVVTKHAVEVNDAKLKESMATSVQALWDFLAQNNAGISQMFHEADAAMTKLAAAIEESKADARLHTPSSVAGGPKGIAFMGLRTDLKKHEEFVKGQVETLNVQFEELKSEVNVAAMAAGAAGRAGDGGVAPDMAELDKLEEAMEDRFALLQVQVESLSLSCTPCPCTTGKCPCKCNGGAPMREPPRARRAWQGPCRGPFRREGSVEKVPPTP
jgi:outer membrane murein-binding lipoprotein Lpp